MSEQNLEIREEKNKIALDWDQIEDEPSSSTIVVRWCPEDGIRIDLMYESDEGEHNATLCFDNTEENKKKFKKFLTRIIEKLDTIEN